MRFSCHLGGWQVGSERCWLSTVLIKAGLNRGFGDAACGGQSCVWMRRSLDASLTDPATHEQVWRGRGLFQLWNIHDPFDCKPKCLYNYQKCTRVQLGNLNTTDAIPLLKSISGFKNELSDDIGTLVHCTRQLVGMTFRGRTCFMELDCLLSLGLSMRSIPRRSITPRQMLRIIYIFPGTDDSYRMPSILKQKNTCPRNSKHFKVACVI